MGEDEFIGAVSAFGGSFPPVNYMFCQGQSLPLDQFSALYALVGSTFAPPSTMPSETTFVLPNLAASALIGTGTSPTTGQETALGQTGTIAALNYSGARNSAEWAGVGYLVVAPTLTSNQSLAINYVICFLGLWPSRPDF